MKAIYIRLSSLCLFLSMSYSACFGQSGQSNQVIKLNDSYNNIQVKGAPSPKKMEVKNSKGFMLDCSGHDFSQIRQMNNGKYPDLIFYVVSHIGGFWG
jgi:hypothetical protein